VGVVGEAEQAVLPQSDLAGLAAGVLDDGDGVLLGDLVGLGDQPVVAVLVEGVGAVDRSGLDGDEGDVEGLVGGEEEIGAEGERDAGVHPRRGVDAEVELDSGLGRRLGVGEDVLVGHEHPGCDEEPGGEVGRAAVLDDDPAHRLARSAGAVEVRLVDEVLRADGPLAHGADRGRDRDGPKRNVDVGTGGPATVDGDVDAGLGHEQLVDHRRRIGHRRRHRFTRRDHLLGHLHRTPPPGVRPRSGPP
jgi:hypothetical protein